MTQTRRTLLQRFTGAAAQYGIAALGTRALALLLIPLYTRYLTVEEFGQVNLAESLAGFLAIAFGLGLPQAMSRLFFKRDGEERAVFVSTLLRSGVAVALVGLGVVFLALPPVLGLVEQWFSVPFFPLVAIALVATFSRQLVALCLRLFQARELPRHHLITNWSIALITAAAALSLVVGLRWGATGLLAGRATGFVVGGVALMFILGPSLRRGFERADLKRALAFSLPLYPYSLVVVLIEMSDRFVIEALRTTEEVGIYGLAATLGGVMIMFNRAVMAAWQPVFYQAIKKPEGGENIARSTTRVLAATALIGTTGALISEDFVRLVFDDRYAAAGALVPWIIGGYVFWLVFAMLNLQTLQAERSGLASVITVASGGVNLTLNLIWVPAFGMLAAAVATFVTYVLQAFVGAVVAQRVHRVPHRWFGFLPPLVIFGGALAVTQIRWPTPELTWAIKTGVLLVALVVLGTQVRRARA